MSEPISGQRPRARFRSGPLGEVVGVFLRLGFLAFGGPAAHIAMMEDELVERRKWLDRRQFLDLLGVTNLIPGPNSTEMAIHLGYLRAGWPGLIAAGVCFIGPAALIVLTLAWLYVRYGGTPEVGWLLYGIKPVILAVVVQAVVRLGRTALTTPPAWLLAALLVALYLLGGHELVLLFGGAVVYALLRRFGRRARGSGTAKGSAAEAGPRPTNLVLASAAPLLLGASGAAAAVPFSLSTLFWTFLKIGSVLYGSGYVLLAFLRNDFVERLGWLDDRQLLDAIAIGQFTPGPVFTTATFVGYLTGGGWGALAATVGIFLPSFILVALVRPVAGMLRRSPWTAALLDGVNIAAIALMAAVLLELARSALVDWFAWSLALVTAGLLLTTRINSAWLILAGAAAGWLARGAGG